MDKEEKKAAIEDVILRYKSGELNLAFGSAAFAHLTGVSFYVAQCLLKCMERQNIISISDLKKKKR